MKAILFAGQGAQRKGMGGDLFDSYRDLVDSASAILGYAIDELCLHDPGNQLNQTQFTQPALFVVNHLNYLRHVVENGVKPDFAAGHSLGEYNALAAAGAFDFATGVRLVQRRGELMSRASGGGMAAVIGLPSDRLAQLLQSEGFEGVIDVANFNTPTQTVISGESAALSRFNSIVEQNSARFIPLNTSAAFHSRYMRASQQEFTDFLQPFNFSAPQFPVIANVTAQPYAAHEISTGLARQVSGSVRWVESVQHMLDCGVTEFLEFETRLLGRMVDEIKSAYTPVPRAPVTEISAATPRAVSAPKPAQGILASQLGDAGFRKEYDCKFAYVAGGMYRGIASRELVARMVNNGFTAFFGAGGVPIAELEGHIQGLKSQLREPAKAGFNLLCNLEHPHREMQTVELYLKHEIRRVEAAAYLQMTEALVYYRVSGLYREGTSIQCRNKVLAKVSRPEVADAFMSPPPAELVDSLLQKGLITAGQAEMSKSIPMAHDVCVEADSGGHTDGGNPAVLFPSMLALQASKQREFQYARPVRLGLAGGIGSPQSATSAFVMGAAFILTGSINQCTVEAGTSDAVKDLLQQINVQDTAYAPAADMFEIGARVQVLKKGVFFPARANKLFALYQQFDSLEDIPGDVRQQLEERFLGRSFESIWQERKQYLEGQGRHGEVIEAERRPKLKMSMVFKWYFSQGSQTALRGDLKNKVNFQVHTGPALGAFNQWVKGTELESWRHRHVDVIAKKLMDETALQLSQSLLRLVS